MNERNEIVVIEMDKDGLAALSDSIGDRMGSVGMADGDSREVIQRWIFSQGWPYEVLGGPTLAQLVVVARALNMRITIRDLAMSPMEPEQLQEADHGADAGISG